jgi:predicted nucleic acid-binding protein
MIADVPIYYVDTSVVGHAVLPGGSPTARVWLDEARAAGGRLVSSRLLHLEAIRLLRRENLDLGAADAAMDRIDLLAIDERCLRFAEAIQCKVKALDAIHLGTALGFSPTLTVASHDRAMLEAAAALGFAVTDPLSAAVGPTPTDSADTADQISGPGRDNSGSQDLPA